jgi:hypothetical protein
MAYRSQLVIRTSAEEGARTLERVKALAEKEGRTISEIALELLARGLDSDLSAPTPAAAAAPSQPAQEPEPSEAAEADADIDELRRKASTPALAPPTVTPKDPSVRPDEAPHDAAVRCVELFGDEGAEAAATALRPFFAAAEPVDGANIREELQGRMSKADYETLMDALKQTEEYRAYRRRVVYASW